MPLPRLNDMQADHVRKQIEDRGKTIDDMVREMGTSKEIIKAVLDRTGVYAYGDRTGAMNGGYTF